MGKREIAPPGLAKGAVSGSGDGNGRWEGSPGGVQSLRDHCAQLSESGLEFVPFPFNLCPLLRRAGVAQW